MKERNFSTAFPSISIPSTNDFIYIVIPIIWQITQCDCSGMRWDVARFKINKKNTKKREKSDF